MLSRILNTLSIVAVALVVLTAQNSPTIDTLRFRGGPTVKTGSGAPEGAVTASPGSLYLRTNGLIYRKNSGTGNTDWIEPGDIRGTGQPQGVVAAELGRVYVDTNTGYRFVKRGGGSTAYGWYYDGAAGPNAGSAPLWFGRTVNENNAVGVPGLFGIDATFSQTASTTSVDTIDNLGFLYTVNTSATSGNSAFWRSPNNQVRWWHTDLDVVMTVRTPADITTLRLWAGLSANSPADQDDYNSVAPAAMLFRYATTASDPGWVCFSQVAAGTETVSANVAAIAASTLTKLRLRFVRTGTPTLYCSVNDGTEISQTGNIPANTETPAWLVGVTTKTTAARSISYRSVHVLMGPQQ